MTSPMKHKISLDKVSLLVTARASVRLRDLERWLQTRGYSLGWVPSSGSDQTLGALLEKGTPNRLALRYGGPSDICVSLKVKGRWGEIVTKRVPRAATGPDLKKIFIGSLARYGRIDEATLRVVPLPEARESRVGLWSQTQQRREFLRRLMASGIHPTEVGVRDRTVRLELAGSQELVAAEVRSLRRLIRETGGRLK